MNLYSAKSIGEYSKALYIKLKNKKKMEFDETVELKQQKTVLLNYTIPF